jgi:integrase
MRAELKLIPPKPGRTSFYAVRGTYLGQYVDRSAKTGDRATARKVLDKIKREIERGEFAEKAGPTFASAATGYMNAGGERRFMAPILMQVGHIALEKVDQAAIDKAAMAICPLGSPATRNRQIYTPITAVLRHAEVALPVRRPKGAQGTPRQHWLRPEQSESMLSAAWVLHPRFAALLTTLLYTGCRLSEALALDIADVHLDEGFAIFRQTKNGEPQSVHLPPAVVRAIRLALAEPGNASWKPSNPKKTLKGPRTEGSVFCLTKSGALYALLAKVEAASGVAIPDGVSFHILRHTYGAWMRRAGQRLEETGRWKSRGGAKAYDHFEISAAAKVADQFPGAGAMPALKIVGEG